MSYVKPSTQYKREHKPDYGKERIEILYQDEWICVIFKPSGLLAVPYPGSQVRTAQSVLEDILRKKGTINARHKPYVVHRLDRDTSGVMMFALNEKAQKVIMDSWHQMVTERLYRCVSENGKESDLQNSGWINDCLAKNAHNVGFVPKSTDKDKNGHAFKTVQARTHYTKILFGPTHTLFELSLDTGKKNQIRAHLSAHGYVIAGDEEHRATTDPFGRLCLHARTLEFNHPFTKEHLKFEIPEPQEWLDYVKNGDTHPRIPIWMQNTRDKKYSKHENINLISKRLTAKDKAHMDFIASGKKHKLEGR